MPQSASNSSFSRSEVSRVGALSGAKNSRGCGSNVSTQAGTPRRAGRALQLGQHGLVAEMHAVEIAYGERGRARGRGGNAARESHTTKPGS